jgi:hypothetical protein
VNAPVPAPLSPHTTSGAIAQRNLDVQIVGAEKRLGHLPTCASCKAQLAGLLLARAQYFGQVNDFDRASELAEAAVKDESGAATLLARAHVRAALHQFSLAKEDIAAAETAGASPVETAGLRITVDDALGDLTAALAAAHARNEKDPDNGSLGEEAILVGETGDSGSAVALFQRARDAYQDASPVPMAFLELQEGLMWERLGNMDAARERFETAHRRLPGYVAAASHLAGVVPDIAEAIAILEPFADSEDPEPASQLAALLLLRGNGERSKQLVARARSSYEALLAKHPEAFADHAARFWLGPGESPTQALNWARRNAQWRTTPASYALWIEAALAADATPEACQALSVAKPHGWKDRGLQAAIRRASAGCGAAVE